MICERCTRAYMDFYGIECRIGGEPYYDLDQEFEGCIGFRDKEEQRDRYESYLFDQGKAIAKGEI